MMKNGRAFIVGNGQSRHGFDLNKLVGHGKILTCNLAFQHFDNWKRDVDAVVALEEYRQEQIKIAEVPKSKRIFPPWAEQFELSQYHGGAAARPRSNAGMNAIIEADRMGSRTIFLLGFDFIIDNEEMTTSNMFTGRKGTRTSLDDSIARVKYFDWFITNPYRHLHVFFVVPDRIGMKLRNVSAPNVVALTYPGLDKMMKGELHAAAV